MLTYPSLSLCLHAMLHYFYRSPEWKNGSLLSPLILFYLRFAICTFRLQPIVLQTE